MKATDTTTTATPTPESGTPGAAYRPTPHAGGLLQMPETAALSPCKPDWWACLEHLFRSQVAIGGTTSECGLLIGAASTVVPGSAETAADSRDLRALAIEALAAIGIAVRADGHQPMIAIASSHDGVRALFKGTHWYGSSGGRAMWEHALIRVPGARRSSRPVPFGRRRSHAVLVPVWWVIGGALEVQRDDLAATLAAVERSATLAEKALTDVQDAAALIATAALGIVDRDGAEQLPSPIFDAVEGIRWAAERLSRQMTEVSTEMELIRRGKAAS
ncbi:hypothetical protein [Elioraea sp.]|uniref:hypothetical protein n=1 Tax=Elioraea sp. TaxID=2185103 RepID=UPI003F71199D